MRDELRRWLDGELARSELPEDLREEADRWEALFGDLRARGPEEAPAGLESRVMRRIEASEAPAARGAGAGAASGDGGDEGAGVIVGALRWLVQPRPVPVPPGLALAAAAALLLLVVPGPFGDDGPAPTGSDTATRPQQTRAVRAAAASPRVYVEFVLQAPDADSVSVAGDFTGWEPRVALQDPDGDGVWSGRVPLQPGVHQYMFVVDGSEWVTDPHAQHYASDGFGNRNAVLAIASPSAPAGT